MADIRFVPKTSGWIAIHNAGGRNSIKTARFLAKANRAGSFQHVKFGDEAYGVPHTYAIKREHIAGFQDWAFEHGLGASWP